MKNPIIDFLLSRKSPPISQIREPGPDDAEIVQMIRVASRVPDHGLLEPWRFILYRGQVRHAVGDYLAKRAAEREGPLNEQRVLQEKSRFSRAPVVIGVVSVPRAHERVPQWEQFLSGGNAAFSLVLAAHALGYGANWVSNWYSDDADSRAFLGLSAEERVVGFVHIGSVVVKIPDRPRPEPRAVLSEFTVLGH